MNTRLLSFFALAVILFASRADAQYAALPKPVNPSLREGHAVVSVAKSESRGVTGLGANQLPESVAIPGSNSLGLDNKFQIQTDGRSLHNVQVDPSNPLNIHAVIMSAPNVTVGDTAAGGVNSGVYATRNCFYTFSSDGGTTWTTPKAISQYRSGFPDMILYKNSANNYVPIIACHQYTSASDNGSVIVCGLYIEKGVPGAGNFSMTVTDRNDPADKTTQNIIWPRIAISADNSTVYMAAAVSPATTADTAHYLYIGTFTLGEGGVAKWNGWHYGAMNDSTASSGSGTLHQGWASGGDYVLAVSPKGKVGLSWLNTDAGTPDLGVYFAESSDGTKTWTSTYTPLWNTTDSSYASGSSTVYLRPNNGIDMFYSGEQIHLLTGFDWETESPSGNTYVPNSGGIMFWNGNPNQAPYPLLGRLQTEGSATGAPATAVDSGAFLSLWNGQSFVNPQGPVVMYPTFGQTTAPNKYAIFFECWVNNDSEFVNDTLVYPYHSIYEKHTSNDGLTWSAAAPVLTNNPSSSGQKYDYHYPMLSAYNASDFSNMKYGLVYMGDTAAGLWESPGYPVWDSVGWYFTTTAGFPLGVGSTQPKTFAVGQNYPNPFATSTSISFQLKNASAVNLTVTDVLGRTIATLINGKELSVGAHSAKFDAGALPNGVYFYTLRANGETFTQRMLLAK